MTVFAEFRHAVRQEARECKAFNILKECDKVRDDTLPNLGVRLEDQEGNIQIIFNIFCILFVTLYTFVIRIIQLKVAVQPSN